METATGIKLFGTDGIRKKVGEFPLEQGSIFKIGAALASLLPNNTGRIVMGRDTRQSGKDIQQWMTAGIKMTSAQCETVHCGVIPTPGLSYIISRGGFDFGIMVTASHNPYTDNGIKIFGSDGEKLPQQLENRIEELFVQMKEQEITETSLCSIKDSVHHRDDYFEFLMSHSGVRQFPGLKEISIVLDCADGATFEMAPRVFREAGYNTRVIHNQPDGTNINRHCGSTYIDTVREAVQENGADIGITFDGDGDRVLFVDGQGRVLDGDYSLYLIARYFAKNNDDFNRKVVGTVMGNLGLEKALRELNIEYVRTPVGDKYVYREMKQLDAALGGEQSGHTILRRFQKSGDGILTAMFFLRAITGLGIEIDEVYELLQKYPQGLKNIRIKEKKDLEQWKRLNEMKKDFQRNHGDNSRLLIRYSGTEPIIRVMIESEEQSVIEENMIKFEELIKTTIGSG
jgi:phosphoglucosamine mutase